jgi:hypothetical protein
MIDLGYEHGGRRLSHGAERRQVPNLLCLGKAAGVVGERFLSIGDDLFDLLGDEVVVPQHPFNVASEERRQRPTITGPHCVQTFS